MYHVYILQSKSTGRFYTGYAADLVQRLGQHNDGVTKSTKNRGPWKLVHSECYETRAEAMRREKYFKTGRGRKEILQILARRSVG